MTFLKDQKKTYFLNVQYLLLTQHWEHQLKFQQLMGEKQIWDLPVVKKDNLLVGLLHLHPAVKKVLES